MKLIWILTGYFFGSFPTGYVFFRLYRKDDIRRYGSGNIGATNIGRNMGKSWAVAVALVDMFKGAAAMFLTLLIGGNDPWLVSLTGFAAVCGHNYPVWLKFSGGKGVSTTFGVVAFLMPPVSFIVAAMGGVIWFLILKLSRYVSLASILSLFSMFLIFSIAGVDIAFIITTFLLACLSTFRHRTNISRIIRGEENRISK